MQNAPTDPLFQRAHSDFACKTKSHPLTHFIYYVTLPGLSKSTQLTYFLHPTIFVPSLRLFSRLALAQFNSPASLHSDFRY